MVVKKYKKLSESQYQFERLMKKISEFINQLTDKEILFLESSTKDLKIDTLNYKIRV